MSRRSFLTIDKDQDPLLKNISPHARKSNDGNVNARSQGDNCTTATSGVSPYTGTFGRAELIHLLKRTMFGVKKSDLDYFTGKPLAEVVNELTSALPSAIPHYPLREYDSTVGKNGNGTVDWGGVALGQEWGRPENILSGSGGQLGISDPTADNFWRDRSLQKWNIGIALNQGRNVFEKLVLFWLNHFAMNSITLNYSQRSFLYTKLIRENVNTDLRELVKEITKDPAYLMYLNGQDNTANYPDENFAREIQELFCIGKEVPFDKRYTEDDVKMFARCLTGHKGIIFRQGTPYNFLGADYGFQVTDHDYGTKHNPVRAPKKLSAFYSNKVITDSNLYASTAGDSELNQLVDIMFDDTDKNISTLAGTEFEGWSRADIVSDFIVKKLYRWFVFSYIDDNIKANVIKPLANIYKQNNFKILPVLKILFASEHFFDMRHRGAMIKTPYDVVIGLLRTTNGEALANVSDVKQRYFHYNALHQQSLGMAMGAIESPNVAGWSPYYQMPQYHELWINSDTLPKRQDFAKRYCGNGGAGTWSFDSFQPTLNHIEFCKTLTDPSDPNGLINELNELFLGIPLTSNQKSTIKMQTLLTGQTTDNYWTQAWNAGSASGATTQQKNVITSRLKSLFDVLVRLEEFQLT
ncbi:hypothetical protein MYP_3089 [Sporocytophaga myxococcoides]|uniref:DUF1800 domain-containing protein n=1 Tax=Sporocytophaga myxococcoides TaxID=153721 RepID=A0A098LFW1_9BACT|nr:hypothetical protein MYP_3089 [Sporocytophaga myxococcoides]